MKTTLNLDDAVLSRARQVAAQRGITLTALIEDALRRVIDEPVSVKPFKLRVVTVRGRGLPAVDPADRRALHDYLDTIDDRRRHQRPGVRASGGVPAARRGRRRAR